jgi:hypothetical protein
LDFKNVTPGVAKTIGLTNNVAAGIATGEETTGVFTVNKGADTQVTLGFDLPTILIGPGEVGFEAALPIGTYTSRLRIGEVDTPTSLFAVISLTSTATANDVETAAFFSASALK